MFLFFYNKIFNEIYIYVGHYTSIFGATVSLFLCSPLLAKHFFKYFSEFFQQINLIKLRKMDFNIETQEEVSKDSPYKKFVSWNEFTTWFNVYQKQNKCKFSVHRSKTIKAAKLKRSLKQELKYYYRHYICVKSGSFESKGRGIRKRSSAKVNCPVFFKIRVSESGNFLELKESCWRHNHSLIEEEYEDQMEIYAENDLLSISPELDKPIDENEANENTCDQSASEVKNADDVNIVSSTTMELDNSDFLRLADDSRNLSGIFQYLGVEKTTDEIRDSPCHSRSLEILSFTDENINISNEKISGDHFNEMPLNINDSGTVKIDGRVGYDKTITIDEVKIPIENRPDDMALRIDNVKKVENTDVNNKQNSTDLIDIKIQTNDSKGRGRPKGKGNKAIGLPYQSIQQKIIPFEKEKLSEKMKIMLGWLVSDKFIEEIISRKIKIKIKDILSELPKSICDELFHVDLLKDFFERSAFVKLKNLIKELKDEPYMCKSCNAIVHSNCVQCDRCLLWFHFQCVGLKKLSTKGYKKKWFCENCHGFHA